MKLLPIAEVEDLAVYAPEGGFISFYNSPYYPHKSGTAVDIYLKSREYEYAPCPVDGRVKRIYEFKPPKPASFNSNTRENLIVLESSAKATLYIRLLHIDPKVRVGERVSVGDELGPLIRSGFFDFWTDPHIHLDVRGCGNLLRAKGSLPLHPLTQNGEVQSAGMGGLKGLEILSVKKEYTLLKAEDISRIGAFWGLSCTVGGKVGILDGGLPHYLYGGIYLPTSSRVKVGERVILGETIIGTVKELRGDIAFFQVTPFSIYVNSIMVHGMSLYLYLSKQGILKIIPKKPVKLPLRRGEYVDLSLKTSVEKPVKGA